MERNWAGNIEYRPARIQRPASLEELREVVKAAEHIRVLGTRHSFNDIADSDTLVSLELLTGGDVEYDPAALSVEVPASITYGRLATELHRNGLALHNLASLPHISVGGAIATATHGSGDHLGNLASAVTGIEIMRSDGEIVRVRRGDADFDGAVVGLGALGIVLRVQLDVQPEYEMVQFVFDDVAWPADLDELDALTAAGDSVSLFTTWGDVIDQVWVKSRVGRTTEMPLALAGARPATVARHPIAGVSAEHCTTQLGVPGLWSDRLPHFRMDFTPSSGDELQSEVLLPRAFAIEAIDALRSLAVDMQPHLLISEMRTVAGDTLWTSPSFGGDSVAFHCTWRPHAPDVMRLAERIEDALAPFDPRPHWGKLFTADRDTLRSRYPHHADFVNLVHRYDPRGAFRNDWLARTIVG